MTRRWAPRALAAALALGAATTHAQPFRRPFACETCISNWYYFDHATTTAVQDWNCRTSSYDGHSGTDFSLRGSNAAIAQGNAVVAAADGVVVAAVDGNYDHCSACASAPDARCGLNRANSVMIRHRTYTSRYAHLRLGSVRVRVGQTVTCGQVVGEIGSSGCSTGAHLHFDVRPNAGASLARVDPFRGGCSARASSLWVSQGSYRGLPGAACEVRAVDAGAPRDAAAPMDAARDAATADAMADATADVMADAMADASTDRAPDDGPEPDVVVEPTDPGQRGLDAGTPEEGIDAALDGGCACRTAPARAPRPWAPWLGLALALASLARRPRRPRR